MKPYFSICIPNYNYAQYIDKTIQSVLDQTYTDYEIIISDNASTDNSVQIVREFKDDRIKIIRNEFNIGFSPNLDRATEYAKGDYIILLSSDDLMAPNALEMYATLIEKYQYEKNDENSPDLIILFSAINIIDSNGIVYDNRPARPWINSENNNISPYVSYGKTFYYHGIDILQNQIKSFNHVGQFASTCFSKDIYKKVCGYNNVHTIDPDTHFAYKCLSLNPVAIYVEKELFSYRIHNNNQKSQEKNQGAPRLFIDRYYYTIEFDDDFLSKIKVSRDELISSYVKKTCGRYSLSCALRNQTKRAFQGFLFATATYPKVYFAQKETYFLLITLLSGPIIPWLYKNLYKRIIKKTNVITSKNSTI